MNELLPGAIADTLQRARQAQGLSVNALAERAGVSRAMIGKIERGESQPTAVLLGRISGALGWSLSQLLARAENSMSRLARRQDQVVWVDPETGYVRRSVSPTSGGPLELVEVELPPKTEVEYPAEAYSFAHHQIWVLAGRLTFREGSMVHDLGPGDCLQVGSPEPSAYVNSSDEPCRYLVVLARR